MCAGITFVETFSITLLSLLSFLKSNVISTVSDRWGLKYGYLGQDAYQRSVIEVALKGMLVEPIQCDFFLCYVSFK